MTPNTIFAFRRELRESIWLWSALWASVLTDGMLPNGLLPSTPWWLVPGDCSDIGLSKRLSATPATVRSWRARLEKAGLIRSQMVDGERRIYFLNLFFYPDAPDQPGQVVH